MYYTCHGYKHNEGVKGRLRSGPIGQCGISDCGETIQDIPVF